MPRLPVDGKKVIEHRITLGTKERDILQDLATSARIHSLDPKMITGLLEDPLRLVQLAYGIATALELIGFETGLPTPGDLPELYTYLTQKDAMGQEASKTGNPSIIELVKNLLSGEYGGYPGGY